MPAGNGNANLNKLPNETAYEVITNPLSIDQIVFSSESSFW